MASDLLTPFLEVERDLCKNFAGLEVTETLLASLRPPARARCFQRRHSLCPVTLANSKLSDGESSTWAPQWKRESRFPCSVLSRIPFRTDRSVSMIEGGVAADEEAPPAPARPPPGLCVGNRTSVPAPASPRLSTRYKTELCRTFEESGLCKYGAKCQFAHGLDELRGLSRHPKYKTEPCRTFHTVGFCPYGARCHFIHNAEELLNLRKELRPPPLRHSLSFAGFPSAESCQPSSRPSSLHLARASSTSPSGSPRLLSPLFPEPGLLRPCPYDLSVASELAGEDDSPSCGFVAAGECDLATGENAISALGFFAASKYDSTTAADDADSALGSFPAAVAKLPLGCLAVRSDCASIRRCAPASKHLLYGAPSGAPAGLLGPPGLLAPPGFLAPPALLRPPGLRRCFSADSLSEESYTSSCSLSSASSGSESPGCEGRRLPIFSRLSVADE
ncbi:uncharacterized protein LOC144052388 [Vanacampus margaritifer]